MTTKTANWPCAPRAIEPAPVPCQCPDCLAHRDPAEYGDRAKMVAAIEGLRGALKRVEFEENEQPEFWLSTDTRLAMRAALESTKRWAHDE